jgi:DNA-binding transcriptional LysR family regulator
VLALARIRRGVPRLVDTVHQGEEIRKSAVARLHAIGMLQTTATRSRARDHQLASQPRIHLAEVSGEPFVSLPPASALRKLTDDLCEQAGFRPAVVFEGDDLSTARGFVAAGLGVAIVPAPRAGSPESAVGPVLYREILDTGAVREICLRWSAERRLLPAAELFRQHVIS